MAQSGLKLRADRLKTRLPCRSPLAARTRPKSVVMAGSRTKVLLSPIHVELLGLLGR